MMISHHVLRIEERKIEDVEHKGKFSGRFLEKTGKK